MLILFLQPSTLLLSLLNEAPEHLFLWEFCDFLEPVNLFLNRTHAEVFSCEFWKIFQLVVLWKKKLQHRQISSVYNFIKTETPADTFSCQFWDIFQPAISLTKRLRHRCFLWILQKIIRTLILENICLLDHCRFFCKNYCSLKWEIKWYLRQLHLKKSMYLFNVFNESKDNDVLLLYWDA